MLQTQWASPDPVNQKLNRSGPGDLYVEVSFAVLTFSLVWLSSDSEQERGALGLN